MRSGRQGHSGRLFTNVAVKKEFLKVSPLDLISLQSVSDNFLGVEFFSWSVTRKFCPQPSRVTRDHARWIPSLFPVRPNSSGYCIFVFSALAFVPRIFAYVAIDNDSGKTPALYFLLLSMSLSCNRLHECN